jgi:hypothetical protein
MSVEEHQSDNEYYTATEDEDEENEIKIINPEKIQIKTSSIKTVYDTYLQNNRTILQPSYQRSLSWSFEKMLLFLDSLYYCPIIPAYILYKLSKKELDKLREIKPNSNTLYECIDGQHRFYVIYMFIKGEPIKVGKTIKYLFIKSKDNNTKLFYTINDNIKQKYKNNIRELNIDEKENFNETNLSIQIITQYLDDISKRNIFNRLQNGERVTTLDKLKNTEHNITNYLREHNYFNSNTLFDFWKDIIIFDGNIETKHGINTNLNKLIYFFIRLIVNTDKKNININYLNLNVNKSIINNTEMTRLDNNIEYNIGLIKKYKSKIIDKLQGIKISTEFYILINNLLVNDERQKFNNLHIILNNKNKLNEFNKIHKDKSKVLKIETMKYYNKKLLELL